MSPTFRPIGRFARWGRRALVTLLILLAPVLVYALVLASHANFGVVASGEAYRSGQMNAGQLARAIQNYGIKSIFNMRGASPAPWYRDEIATAAQGGARHYDFALSASQEVGPAQMNEIIQALRAAPKPVLIHCKNGSDRAGLISALYCLAIKGQTPAEAAAQLSIWHGHVPQVQWGTIAMDHSFWSYVSNSMLLPNTLARH